MPYRDEQEIPSLRREVLPGPSRIPSGLYTLAFLFLLGCAAITMFQRAPSVEHKAASVEPPEREPEIGSVTVSSQPAGLRVELDGATVGATPLRLEVAPGTHHLAVRHGERLQEVHLEVAGTVAVDVDFTQLGGSEIRRALGDLAAEIAICSQAKPSTGTLDLLIIVRPDGRPSAAKVEGELAGTLAARCAEKLARAARFPKAPEITAARYPVVLL